MFGNLDMEAVAAGTEQIEAKEQSATSQNKVEMELLQLKLDYAERERDESQRREREQAQNFREERDRLLSIIETQTKQIAAISPPTNQAQNNHAEKRGFWKRVFS